jgi:hypothetical protein
MQLNSNLLFWVPFLLTIGFLWIPVAWTFMGIALPRSVLDRYFREPHFNKGELIVFGSWPGTALRTTVFMAACYQSRYRVGRKLDSYLEWVPDWYVRASKALSVALLIHFGLVMLLWLGVGLYMAFGG